MISYSNSFFYNPKQYDYCSKFLSVTCPHRSFIINILVQDVTNPNSGQSNIQIKRISNFTAEIVSIFPLLLKFYLHFLYLWDFTYVSSALYRMGLQTHACVLGVPWVLQCILPACKPQCGYGWHGEFSKEKHLRKRMSRSRFK